METIEIERTLYTSQERFFPSGILNYPYFEHFFDLRGLRVPESIIKGAQESRFILFSADDLFLSNAHVIKK